MMDWQQVASSCTRATCRILTYPNLVILCTCTPIMYAIPSLFPRLSPSLSLPSSFTSLISLKQHHVDVGSALHGPLVDHILAKEHEHSSNPHNHHIPLHHD